jgi:adenylosuccinate lyase
MGALAGEGSFRDLLAADAEIVQLLTPGEIDRCFDLDHALAYAGAIVDRALAAP